MMQQRSYRIALALALFLHVFIMGFLFSKPSQKQPVLKLSASKETSQPQSKTIPPEEQAIKAVSVDSQEVMETVNRIKNERQQKKRAEERKQLALKKQADQARKQRIEEQKKLARIKEEAAKLAKEQKKKLADEKKRLQRMAREKEAQQKQLAEMKKKQQELKEKQLAEAKRRAEEKKKQAELAKVEAAKKRQIEAERVAREAEEKAQIAGEVDKYKALIINSISRQWILPDNVEPDLSSQFRIRLAPTGAVLDVNLTRSSGDPILDRSAQSAIYKASPLPVPSDPKAFNMFRDISLTVRPENVRG